jgi:hypothetical protein
MPFAREAEVVLAMWRDAERRLGELPTESPEREALESEIKLLRDEYQRLVELAQEHHREEPPPFSNGGVIARSGG